MSFRARRRKLDSTDNVQDHRVLMEPPGTSGDAPITTYVDQMSQDHRRVHRAEVPLPPPSPVKRMVAQNQARADARRAACDETFSFEPYRLPFDNSGDPLNEDNEGGNLFDDSVLSKPVKPPDKSLSEWRPKLDSFASEFLRLQGRGAADVDWCPGCGAAEPTQWVKPGLFRKTALATLGLRVQLGHRVGDRCEAPERGHKEFVVLHTNGIHVVEVDFCGAGCRGNMDAGPPEIQLLRARWFPATHERPRSCATMDLLDQFQEGTLQAKTTMYDAYRVLERLTNNTGVKPPDRYHEWIRMCREYAHLLMLMQAGRLVAYDPSGAAGTKPGECAVECPACPRPGVNMPPDWETYPAEERYKFTLCLAFDACFRLKRRLVSSELKDPDLGSGFAYMVESEPYREYLRTVTNQKEMNTCSGLAALDYANTNRTVWGTYSAENGKFANMDYVFGSVMRHKHPRQPKLCSYDIVWIWIKFLKDRMAKMPALVRLDLIMKLMLFVIPKLHILGHKSLCRLMFSLNLTRGSGQLDGEGIERPWASIGALASSTREMGPGARHGVLDAQWGSWNWQKLIDIVGTLRRRMDNAKEEYARQKEALDAFSAEQAESVPAWKARVDEFEKLQLEFGADGIQENTPNSFAIKVEGMTEPQVRLKLSQQEAEDVAKGVPSKHDVTPSKFIACGLDIEAEQRRVRVQAQLKKANTTGMQIDLVAMRTSLTRRILRFRRLQETYTPNALQVLQGMTIAEDAPVETMPLLLPSALTVAQRELCSVELAVKEEEMRNAQCREALVNLRNQLHVKSRFLVYKGLHSRNQGSNTRARGLVTRNETKIRLHSEKYQMAWEAIRRLSPSGNPSEVGWELLKATDVRCLEDEEDLKKKVAKLAEQEERRKKRKRMLWEHGQLEAERDSGDDDPMQVDSGVERGSKNRRQVSWIWMVTGTDGTDTELEDALRIEWSKAYARTRRWEEEIQILEAEYKRVLLTFEYEASRWDKRAENVSTDLAWAEVDGATAFARRQAAMFRDLRARGEITWTEKKLKRGEKRARRVPPTIPGSNALDQDDREEEEEREEEAEEAELLQGDAASDEDPVGGGRACNERGARNGAGGSSGNGRAGFERACNERGARNGAGGSGGSGRAGFERACNERGARNGAGGRGGSGRAGFERAATSFGRTTKHEGSTQAPGQSGSGRVGGRAGFERACNERGARNGAGGRGGSGRAGFERAATSFGRTTKHEGSTQAPGQSGSGRVGGRAGL
ncbi:hypothetical protein C8F04DRAFT_1272079 [Mycena alexandri]|uniref:CxC2-like cysteine cluster KDZ transposase-associated domain-containing protein n=1 Tax=Mycena alexandri TaxID=1745969 RepID=A0AAD6SA32_9AGAR|nr:hypothetical protein C8F04DRAFT_1272079 [Mycena alexandri]